MAWTYYNKKKIIRCPDTGETVTGDRYLMSQHWRQFRERIWKERGCECERCHDPLPLNQAVIHHKIYKRIGREKDTDVALLCNRCHRIIHKDRRDDRQKRKDIMYVFKTLSRANRDKVYRYAQRLYDEEFGD